MPRPERIRLLGDRLVLVELDDVMDAAVNARVHDCARLVAASGTPGVTEIVPAISALGIHVDPLRVDLSDLFRTIEQALAASRAAPADEDASGPIVSIPVCYGGNSGPDLPAVASWAGLTQADVCARHAAPVYRVFMIGFSPGFAYLGTVDPVIATPRLPSPRVRVEAGAVGVAGPQTGIYPQAGPGGWRIIGRTFMKLFDPGRTPPALLRTGHRVRFVPIDDRELERGLAR